MEKHLDTKGIDGIRGIGAVCIALFSHYYFWVSDKIFPFYNGVTHWFWNYASYFVDMFFIISGFIMVYVYKDKINNKVITFSDFIKKRMVRFYPLMVFSLFLVALLQFVHYRLCGECFADKLITDYSLLAFVLNLLCLQGTSLVNSSFNAPSWYLSTVLIMYILFFVITYWAGQYKKEKMAYVAMVLLGLVLAIKAYPTVLLNCRGVLGFFTGCTLCEICCWYSGINKKKQKIVNSILLVLLVCICACGIIYSHDFFSSNVLVVVVYTIVIWPLVVFLVVNVPIFSRIMSIKPLQFLSKISFSLYLIHYPVMIVLNGFNEVLKLGISFASKKGFLLYVFAVFVAAIMCHYLIEVKMTNYFKGLIDEKKL